MVYDIVIEPNPILHRRSADLTPPEIKTPETQRFIKDMIETMYVKDGVGLASVQVGKSIQLCVIAKNFNELNKKQDLCLINPTWTKISRHTSWDEEGCLSVPGLYGKVKRYTNIKVTALDLNGQPLEFIAEDFFARIIQHEADHLNGILFIEKAKDLHKFEKYSSTISPQK
jgi:peptide deformylase